jgi:hypothetical protein
MKKVTSLKLGGVVLGFLMLLGSFFRWTVLTGVGAGASWRSKKFLAFDMYSSDELFGFHAFPILAGALFMLLIAGSDKSIYIAVLAGLVSLLCFLLTTYNLIYWKRYPLPPDRWIEIEAGMYLTLGASLLAMPLVLLIRKSLSTRTN